MIQRIKIYFLRIKVQRAGRFSIAGYERCLVYMHGNHLDDWEVEQIHKWEVEGRIIEDGTRDITSWSSGVTYTNKMYTWNKQKAA